MMRKVLLRKMVLLGAMFCIATNTSAYQVWTSTCKTPNIVLDHKDQWDVVAANLGGFNANFAPTGYDPKSYKPSESEWKQIIACYTTARQNVYQPYAHPDGPFTNERGSDYVTGTMKRACEWGYTLKYFMLYDKGYTNSNGKKYIATWKADEVQLFRNWLDNNDYTDVKLIYNARSYNARELIAHPAIDAGLNEGSTEKWMTNDAGRHELLRWMTTDERVRNKPFFFQITCHHDFDQGNVYEATRLLVRAISAEILGSTDWIRTDKAIILPMTYQDFPETFPFLPERESGGDSYGNSMTGLLCSLIEQKDRFEGREGDMTEAMCASFARPVPGNKSR